MKIKVEIKNEKRSLYFIFPNVKKLIQWQDIFAFFDNDGTVHRFELLEVENIWANGNKIYEKH